jgi:hypothetical protein
VRRPEIVVAEVMFAVPLTVNPDAVTFPADRVTPPITEFPAEIVELIMETPAIELLIVAGVEIDPLTVIAILGEEKFEPVSIHPPMVLVVSDKVVILPLCSVTFPILLDDDATFEILPPIVTFEPTLKVFVRLSVYAFTV